MRKGARNGGMVRKRRALVDQKMVRRLAESFMWISSLDEKAKVNLAGKLAMAFMRKSSLSRADQRKYLADFMFHMGEMGDDLAKMNQVMSAPEKCSMGQCRDALEGFLWHAANHIHAAATLYTGWTLTYLVPLREPKGKAKVKKG